MVGLAGDVDTAEDLEPAAPPTLTCISSGHLTLLFRDEQTSLGRKRRQPRYEKASMSGPESL
jgi:hypothetical protein